MMREKSVHCCYLIIAIFVLFTIIKSITYNILVNKFKTQHTRKMLIEFDCLLLTIKPI